MRSTPTTPTRRRFRGHWLMTAVLAVILAAGALAFTRVDVSAANLQIAQCNSGNGGGSVIACSVTVVNNLNGNLTSSTVTVARHCAGVARFGRRDSGLGGRCGAKTSRLRSYM